MKPLCETIAMLGDVGFWGRIGLWVPGSPPPATDPEHPATLVDCDLAAKVFSFGVSLVSRRLRSVLWHCKGFPGSSPLLLEPKAAPAKLMEMRDLFRISHNDVAKQKGAFWNKFRDRSCLDSATVAQAACCLFALRSDIAPGLKHAIGRSGSLPPAPWRPTHTELGGSDIRWSWVELGTQTTPARQVAPLQSIPPEVFLQACAGGWCATDDLQDIIKGKFGGMFGTKLIEDCFPEGRSLERKGSNRNNRIRPSRLWHKLWTKQVDSTRHSYTELPWPRSGFTRGVAGKKLKECLTPRLGHMSHTMRGVRATSSSTPWFSPAPLHACIQDIDLALMKTCEAEGSWQKAGHGWLCCLVRGLQLMVRRRSAGGRWYYCMGGYAGACIIGWPLRRAFASHEGYAILDPEIDHHDLLVDFLYDPELWGARLVKSCSPLRALGRGVSVSQLGAVVLEASPEPTTLLQACAKGCFGTLPKTTLVSIAKFSQVKLPMGGGVVDILDCMVKHFLPAMGDNELLKVLESRVKFDTDDIGEFLASPETSGLMHEDDQTELVKVRKETASTTEDSKTFATELKAKRAQVMANIAPPLSKKARTASSNRLDRAKIGPPQLDERLTEERLNGGFPPGSMAWADTWNSRWQLFYGSKRCKSFAWNRYGYVGAARLSLIEVWNLHAQHGGTDPPHILGLSSDVGRPSSGAASSSGAPPA